jgi:glycosyltransferase involved in cell wall biosynthesis
VRVAFVYPNSRREMLAGVADGSGYDSQLHGAMYLHEHDIDVVFHDPLLTRRRLPGPLNRIAWNARELTIPFELRGVDAIFTPLGAAGLPLAARLKGLPVVIMNFGLNLIWRRASEPRRAFLRRSLGTAARIVCFGESQATELVELTGLRPDHVVTLPLPIDDRFFAPEPAPLAERARPAVLSVGKDLARDYATVVAAVEHLDADVDLVTLPRNLEGIRLPANVRVLTNVPSVELRDLYARADCVVVAQKRDEFAYGSEGGGLTTLLEGMAMERPVVATERAIFRDYVDDGVEGLVVPPEDPAAMRAAIERTLADRELARSLGSAGRARVERSHTSSGFAALLAPLLRDVVYARRA